MAERLGATADGDNAGFRAGRRERGGWSFIQVEAARHKGWNLAAPAELK